MKKMHIHFLLFSIATAVVVVIIIMATTHMTTHSQPKPAEITGSKSCKPCHERFYHLWEPSHHGKAMQPYTAEFAKEYLVAQAEPIKIGNATYRADISGKRGWIIEKGPNGTKRYEIVHVMGGKNVFFFLTMLERGRLQTFPLAFRIKSKE